jgi:hypothetical protein
MVLLSFTFGESCLLYIGSILIKYSDIEYVLSTHYSIVSLTPTVGHGIR